MNRDLRVFAVGVFALMTLVSPCPSAMAGQNVLYVDDDAKPGGDGLSWEAAYDDLQTALAQAAGSPFADWEIRVAQGLYKPAPPGGDRDTSFDMDARITLRGGYAGVGTNDPDAWNPDLYETILSGDLNGDDGPDFANNSDNSFHVLRAFLLSGDPVPLERTLEGLTITAGNADGTSQQGILANHGGGLFTSGARPTVRQCRFEGNKAGLGGGALVFEPLSPGSAVGAVFEDCLFLNNTAVAGGGLSFDSFLSSNQPLVTRCRFIGNHANLNGGGLEYFNGGGPCIVESSLFAGNTAGSGGAIIADGGDVVVNHSTLFSNHATSLGGAAVATWTITLNGCIVWANSGNGDEGELGALFDPDQPFIGELNINNSIIQGWTGILGGVANIGDDPLFVDSVGPDGVEGTLDDDLRLMPSSPAVNSGPPDVTPQPALSDLDGHPRVLCGIVDRGAYESGIGDFNCDGTLTMEDFSGWASCVTGPVTTGFDQACLSFDFDNDQTIDLRDYAKFAAILSVR